MHSLSNVSKPADRLAGIDERLKRLRWQRAWWLWREHQGPKRASRLREQAKELLRQADEWEAPVAEGPAMVVEIDNTMRKLESARERLEQHQQLQQQQQPSGLSREQKARQRMLQTLRELEQMGMSPETLKSMQEQLNLPMVDEESTAGT